MVQSNGADHQAELDQRLERYVNGDMHALDGFDEHVEVQQTPIVMTSGQRQVRAGLERQRPTLDPVTQKLWDDWFDRRFNKAIKPLAKGIGKRVGSLHNELVKDIDENLGAAEKENEKCIAAHNELVQGVERIQENVKKLSTSVRADMAEAIKRLDRNFVTEVAELRAKTLVNLSEDISAMRADVIAIVRASVMDDLVAIKAAAIDEMRKDMNAAVADKFQKLRGAAKRFVGWLSQRDRQFLVEEVRANLKDELMSEVRNELAAEFIRMREDVCNEISKSIETPHGSFKE